MQSSLHSIFSAFISHFSLHSSEQTCAFFELSEAGNLRVEIRKRLILGLLNSDTIRPSIKFLFLENLERLPVGMRTEIINEAMGAPDKPSLEAIKQELAWIRLSLPPVTVN